MGELAAAAQEEWLCKGVGKEAAAAEQSSCVVGQWRQRRAAVPGGRLIHSSAVGEYALRGGDRARKWFGPDVGGLITRDYR